MNQSILKVNFQNKIAHLAQQEKEILKAINSLEQLKFQSKSSEEKYKSIGIITYYVALAEIQLKINNDHFSIFAKKSEPHIENCRKMIGTCIRCGEHVFGLRIGNSIAESSKQIESLDKWTPTRAYHLIFRIHTVLSTLKKEISSGSSKRSTFISNYRDISGLLVNMIDFKNWLIFSRDLHHPFYEDSCKIFTLMCKILDLSADLCMESYHINKTAESFDKSIAILDYLENLQRLIKDPNLKETSRKKESWNRSS